MHGSLVNSLLNGRKKQILENSRIFHLESSDKNVNDSPLSSWFSLINPNFRVYHKPLTSAEYSHCVLGTYHGRVDKPSLIAVSLT